MEEIRKALLQGKGNRLSKNTYKQAVEIEKSRLFQQLIFLGFVAFIVACVLFMSLYFEFKH